MSKPKIRGVNDIPNRMSQPRGQSEPSLNAALLARLERQKSLLEKQLAVWVKQKTAAEARLRTVDAQIGAALRALVEPRAPAPATLARGITRLAEPKVAPKRSRALDFAF